MELNTMTAQESSGLGTGTTRKESLNNLRYEFIDSKQLASRWNLPESWVREQVRSRSIDPIPHIRFTKYVRFRWGSPELEEWMKRRIVSNSNRVVGRALGKESK